MRRPGGLSPCRNDIAAILQALRRSARQWFYPTKQGLRALVSRPTSVPVPTNWKPNGYL
jgi:general secretion pathway protein G